MDMTRSCGSGYTTFYEQDSKRRKLLLLQQKSEELLGDNTHDFNFGAPYHKLDRQLFETMLKYLSKEDEETLVVVKVSFLCTKSDNG